MTPLRRLAAVIAIIVTALAVITAGGATAAQGDPRVKGARVAGVLTPAPTRATAGVITLSPTVPSGSDARANKAAQKRLTKANPRRKAPRVVRPYRGPALGAPTADDTAGGAIDRPDTGGTGAGGGQVLQGRRGMRETASTDLSAFRVSTVTDMDVTGSPSGPDWIGEPTAANDRNAILFTANWYAAFSSDNGRTWGYIDPVTAFPSLDGGFCCDQYAVSIPRDGYNDIAWVMQNATDASDNSYRLVVLSGRSGIASLAGTIEYCSYIIRPGDFAGMPSRYMLDYPAIQPTEDWLYLTAVAAGISASTTDRAVIWRVGLDDLDECGGPVQTVAFEDVYSLRPVTGAAERSTMFMGTLPLGASEFGKEFDIYWVSDSSTTVSAVRRNVADWPTGQPTCKVSGSSSNDPCGRLTGLKVLAGYRSSSRVGFLFTTGVGSSSTDYPYTRLVRFDPSSLALTGDYDIWHDDYAWTFPSAGVTNRGDVAGALTVVGGSVNPKATAYMVDDITNTWSAMSLRSLTTSDTAPNGSCSSSSTGRSGQCLGDYFTAAAYTGCSNTMLATAVVQQTAAAGSGPAHRSAWFGRERDACADLQVTGVTAGPTSSGGTLEGGGQVSAGDTTRNTGAADMPATTTAYYLSRDETKGASDTLLGSRAAGSIPAGSSSVAMNQWLTLPDSAYGEYYIVACADDAEAVDEVSDSNNCAASAAISLRWAGVTRYTQTAPVWQRSTAAPEWAGAARAGVRITVTARAGITPVVQPGADLGRLAHAAPEAIPWDIFLTLDVRVRPRDGLIGHLPTGPLKSIPMPGGPLRQWTGTLRSTVILPKVLPAGRYHVMVCAPESAAGIAQGTGCTVARTPLIVRLPVAQGVR